MLGEEQRTGAPPPLVVRQGQQIGGVFSPIPRYLISRAWEAQNLDLTDLGDSNPHGLGRLKILVSRVWDAQNPDIAGL